ncbi:MAG: LysE family translocator [Oligoflexia bacterium]|nr:LysE family translocator [Oligoflexia bacterium]
MLSFFLASLLLAVAPGPDNVFVITQSAIAGRRAGLCVVLGLCTGLLFHTAAVALGVATFVQSSPLAFSLLRIAGALYLLTLAWQSLRSSESIPLNRDDGDRLSARKLYLRGIVMNVTNPKVTLFFLAFLPQFVEPAKGGVALQLALLGMVFVLATAMVFSALAAAAGAAGRVLSKSPRFAQAINRVAALIFIALAAKLLAG